MKIFAETWLMQRRCRSSFSEKILSGEKYRCFFLYLIISLHYLVLKKMWSVWKMCTSIFYCLWQIGSAENNSSNELWPFMSLLNVLSASHSFLSPAGCKWKESKHRHIFHSSHVRPTAPTVVNGYCLCYHFHLRVCFIYRPVDNRRLGKESKWTQT